MVVNSASVFGGGGGGCGLLVAGASGAPRAMPYSTFAQTGMPNCLESRVFGGCWKATVCQEPADFRHKHLCRAKGTDPIPSCSQRPGLVLGYSAAGHLFVQEAAECFSGRPQHSASNSGLCDRLRGGRLNMSQCLAFDLFPSASRTRGHNDLKGSSFQCAL